MRYAGENGYPVSVKGGGHDWGGRSMVEDGIVIDLSRLKSVVIDTAQLVATVGGGVLSGELVDAAEDYRVPGVARLTNAERLMAENGRNAAFPDNF